MRTGTLILGVLGALLTGPACRSTGEKPTELSFELDLEFEGETSFDEARLAEIVRAELARLEVAAPDKAAIDDAAFALEVFYRERGYADVRVDYEYEPVLPARARFVIEEGPILRVREFVIEGPTEIDVQTVRALFFEPMASGGIFVESQLDRAVANLRDKYLESGYLQVQIEPPEIVFDDDRSSVAVRITLHEGLAFRVRAVDISGGTPELARREAQIARQHSGRILKLAIVPEIRNALIEAYERGGYPDVAAEARTELDETTGDARIAVEVRPGDRVRIAHFRIEGNEKTKDSTILNLVGIERGSTYDSEVLRESFRELYAKGLFETLTLELEGEGPERTLVISVVEAPSLQIRLEPGWGSYEGPRVLVGIEQNNFRGRAQVLSLETTASLLAQEARAAWIDRDFLGSTFTSETTAFVEHRVEPSFEFMRRGFGFFVRRKWTQEWSSTVGYEFRPTDVTDDDFQTLPLGLDGEEGGFDSDITVGAVSLALTFDDRDNPLIPTRGGRGLARLEWADDGVWSDTEFLRTQLEYTYLKRLGDRSVLAASVRTGVVAPFGKTDVIPLPERYFNGGENSVRSFEEDQVLAKGQSGEPQGGESATTLNLEWRRSLGGNLAGALFFDAGNVTALPLGTAGSLETVVDDYLRFDGFRTGVGIGIRYLLPIGPVRLDLGYNPNARSDEDDFVLHFSVGFPF